ncbi:MAG: ankyrin repeat domain-containing protein [Verrucomicrobiae bacterium]|nr:ankyrin repeat domain-containing protein [Verrucomicrobiae bacterium]
MNSLIAIALIGWLAGGSLLAAGPGPDGTVLFQAIREGDSRAVRKLLKAGADLQSRDEAGDTPLMAAALHADTGLLERLLRAGAKVNATNQAGATALMRAATFRDKARLLLGAGADPGARSAMGNTVLILAARQPGNAATVKRLLDRGADVNATNAFGATALMAAVAAEDLTMARLLLDHGAEVNAVPAMNEDGFLWGGGRTALGWAAFRGHEPLVKLLLRHGARTDVPAMAGTPLTQAGWAGHAGVARLLLDAGAPVDQRDLLANYTALHWAASSEHASPALVGLLLARGADPNAEGGQPVDNYLGVAQTPLMLARRRGDTPIVHALLTAGARDAATPAGRSKSAGTTAAAPRSASAAIERALPALARTAEESVSNFRRHASHQECISCHQQQLPLAAISLAASRQFTTDPGVQRRQLDLLTQFISSTPITLAHPQFTALEMNLQSTFHPEPAISDGYASLDFQLARQPATVVTDALVHQLATIEAPDGRWHCNLPRPPIQASDITATAQALHALQSYPIPARRKELKQRVNRARAWLANAPAETNEERVHQLLGLAWAGEKPGTLGMLAEGLIRQQRADGGWGQLAGLESDAYGTGQALYALMEGAGIAASHPAVQRGTEFLLRTQRADGTWHVRTRAHPFQPPMDSGFPHGRDGWISAAGTSWAVMALATTLDPAHRPQATPAIANVAAAASEMAAASTDNSGSPVEFILEIQPVLERSCLDCHSGERPKGGFAMSDRASLLKGGNRGEPVVVPGDPDAGQLIHLVQDQVEDLEMPPVAKRGSFPALTPEEAARLRAWIVQGVAWPDGVTLKASGK